MVVAQKNVLKSKQKEKQMSKNKKKPTTITTPTIEIIDWGSSF